MDPEKPTSLVDYWSGLRDLAQEACVEADREIKLANKTVGKVDKHLTRLIESLPATWPHKTMRRTPRLGGSEKYVWQRIPRAWIDTYYRQTRANHSILMAKYEWLQTRSQRIFKERYTLQYRVLKSGFKTSHRFWKILCRQTNRLYKQVNSARRRANWLLEQPLREIRRPTGLARYLPFGRGGSQYRIKHLLTILSAQRMYRVAVNRMEPIRQWISLEYQANLLLEMNKLAFYRGLIRPKKSILEIIFLESKSALRDLHHEQRWTSDVAEMERLLKDL